MQPYLGNFQVCSSRPFSTLNRPGDDKSALSNLHEADLSSPGRFKVENGREEQTWKLPRYGCIPETGKEGSISTESQLVVSVHSYRRSQAWAKSTVLQPIP